MLSYCVMVLAAIYSKSLSYGTRFSGIIGLAEGCCLTKVHTLLTRLFPVNWGQTTLLVSGVIK